MHPILTFLRTGRGATTPGVRLFFFLNFAKAWKIDVGPAGGFHANNLTELYPSYTPGFHDKALGQVSEFTNELSSIRLVQRRKRSSNKICRANRVTLVAAFFPHVLAPASVLLSRATLRTQSPAMPTIPLHVAPNTPIVPHSNPLPQLLQTPTGLAILEIQGTINLPSPDPSSHTTPIGRLVFPDYSEDSSSSGTAWMKTVHLYVGQHQRLTGEVKKMPNQVAVIRKREDHQTDSEELEIVEVVYWKVVFSSRPEPVGT